MISKVWILSLLSLNFIVFLFLFFYSNTLDPSQFPIFARNSNNQNKQQTAVLDKWKDFHVIVSWGNFDGNTFQDALIIDRGTGKAFILKNAGPQTQPQLSPLQLVSGNFDFKQTYGVTLFDYDNDGDDDFFLSTKTNHYFFVNQWVDVYIDKTVKGIEGGFVEKGIELGLRREKSDEDEIWCYGVSSCHSIDEKGKGSIIIGCVKEKVNSSFCEEYCEDEDRNEDSTPSITIFQGLNKKANTKFAQEISFVRGDEILFAISSNIEETKEEAVVSTQSTGHSG
eukprot:TRINITY_DN5368_c0_g1_i2.p1 TRINITY_DN5368_c0_g1~~TRINITY_DN5368_c0_g1_i2.p1  ORF type:complete len:282 (-),score=71.24 TRINITY_DN5368_c0_g1_i2:190-1035(-)